MVRCVVGKWSVGRWSVVLIKPYKNTWKFNKTYIKNLRKKQIQIFINFPIIFSKNILEKPHLVYTDNVRYFVCTFNWLDRFRAHDHDLGIVLRESRPIFQTFKIVISSPTLVQNTPSPLLTPSFRSMLAGWFKECLLVSQQVHKDPTLSKGGKGEEKQNVVKSPLFRNIM